MYSGWREPTWFERPAGRILFLRELEGLDMVRMVTDAKHRDGFSLLFKLQPIGLPPRRARITFSRALPDTPKVWVDGPSESPHRYEDGALCMWHPEDLPAKRWVRRDGAAVLVAHIAAHLLREEWYRKTGDWKGDEVTHGPVDERNDPAEAGVEHVHR